MLTLTGNNSASRLVLILIEILSRSVHKDLKFITIAVSFTTSRLFTDCCFKYGYEAAASACNANMKIQARIL